MDEGTFRCSLRWTVRGKEERTRREVLVLSRGRWEQSLFVVFFFGLTEQ